MPEILNKSKKFITLLILPILLSACADVGIFAINLPTYFKGLHIWDDVAYGSHIHQKLDIYDFAKDKNNTLKPVVIFIYGGRWTDGKKQQYRFIASKFVEAGYIVAIPDYAKYPQVKFPVFVEDIAEATAWIEKNIAQYGGNKNKIYVVGHSAGAHMGALMVSDERYLKKFGSSPQAISAFVGLAGPYAFTPDEPDLQDMFGPPSQYPNMQAPTFIDGQEPPMQLLTAGKDTIVGKFNAEKLEKAIHLKGGSVESKSYEDLDHISIISSFGIPNSAKNTLVRDCIHFLARH